MSIEQIINQLFDCNAYELVPESLIMTQEQLDEVIEQLKRAADRNWGVDPNCSYVLANRIIKLGEMNNRQDIIARGKMARGDARKDLGNLEEAWQDIADAETLYLQLGDEVGAAATWIGRLFMSLDLKRSDEALEKAAQAATVFRKHSEYIRLVRLEINRGTIHDMRSEYETALEIYEGLLESVDKLVNPDRDYRPVIYAGMASSLNYLGEFSKSLEYFDLAHQLFLADNQQKRAAVTEYNKGYVLQTLGHFTEALKLFRKFEKSSEGRFPRDAAYARRSIVECYLLMKNRLWDAYELVQEVIRDFQKQNAQFEVARSLGYLAVAQANLGMFDDALQTLAKAEQFFVESEAKLWLALTYIRTGRIAIQQHKWDIALDYAQRAVALSEEFKSTYLIALAKLLCAEIYIQQGQVDFASELASEVLVIATELQIPALRYSANVILGESSERLGSSHRAVQYFQNALDMLDELQRYLTISLRAGFLEDKQKAFHGMLCLQLGSNDFAKAFETLETHKSQAILQHLFNPEMVRWQQRDGQNQQLLTELSALRAEYQGLFHSAYDQVIAAELEDNQLLKRRTDKASRIHELESQIRKIVEQLYLASEETSGYNPINIPRLADIQPKLGPNSILVEFFHTGQRWYAFMVTLDTIQCYELQLDTRDLMTILDAFGANLSHAMSIFEETKDCKDARLTKLTARLKPLFQSLYQGLLGSFADQLKQFEQIIVVPYRELHYVPFNLLHSGEAYLIEHHEIVILPSASLLTRPLLPRPKGAVSVAYANGQKLKNIYLEAQQVHAVIGGDLYPENQATSSVLAQLPCQVLHIAAHGAYRIDAPEFSYVELANGPIYMDDLLQHDLSYELVTLSACETGRATIMGNDELIGLGRGFLLAGAQALIMSLWLVEDITTIQLMDKLYRHLHSGASKSAALRRIQTEFIQANPDTHPFLWGAFQLIGNPQPLSI